MGISFDNTEIAFASKSNKDLKHAYWLFRLMSSRFFLKTGTPLVKAAIQLRLPVKPLIRSTIFKHFCGGETIAECEKTILQLRQYGIESIPDYSVEGKEREEDFDLTLQEILRIIERQKGNHHSGYAVFKPTGIARIGLLEKKDAGFLLSLPEQEEFEKMRERFKAICKAAYDHHVRLLIDAEESWIQDTVDNITAEMMSLYNKKEPVIFNTFQMYRRDRLAYLQKAHAHAAAHHYFLGLKLVRGAYLEKERKRAAEMNYPSPVYDTKEETDRDYDLALRFCMDHIDRVAIMAGTHNESSCLYLAQLLREKSIEKNHPHISFSQLYGMSDHISFNLAKAGYNVTKYIPYGPVTAVLPYLIRRAEENTAIAGSAGRELSLIEKELNRKKMQN